MFNKALVPEPNSEFQQFLNAAYDHTTATADQKAAIEKKLEKIDLAIKDKISGTMIVSEYFDQLWTQSDLKDADKDFVIKKLECIQQNKKLEIYNGDQSVAKVHADLDVVNSSFKMTPYEEFNLQEKIKDIKKKKNIDLESGLVLSYSQNDLEVLHALNRPFYSVRNAPVSDGLHYAIGLRSENDDGDLRNQKAEDFIKKIKDEKKAFKNKMKQIEQNTEDKINQDFERLRRRELEDEEMRQKEKKDRLESKIKELKARSEARIKDQSKWEEDYKQHKNRKPLFQEIEDKYKQGFLIPELEERKRKLQEIRDFHKPINRDDLVEHERNFMRNLEEQSKKKDQSESAKWIYRKPEYESRHHKVYADEISKMKRQKEEDFMEKLKRKEKVMELLQEVKDKHYPKADPQKELELMGLIDKLKNPNKRRDNRSKTAGEEDRPEEFDAKKLGAEYLKSVKELVRRKKEMSKTHKEDVTLDQKRNSQMAGDQIDKKQTSNSLKSEPTILKKHNYLADLRRENKIQDSSNHLSNIIKNKKLDGLEKKELLQSQIDKLEEKARRKEQIRKFKSGGAEEDEEVDQIYINAIKAKLEMLGTST